MDDTLVLDAQWPDDLDPATVPFLKRSVTILRHVGYFDDWALFNTLTGAGILSWTMAGVGDVADIRTTGNAAIVEYHGEVLSLGRSMADVASLVDKPWARHIWDRDPRFKAHLPRPASENAKPRPETCSTSNRPAPRSHVRHRRLFGVIDPPAGGYNRPPCR